MTTEKLQKNFKYACYAEFFSCFLLFIIAMPLKYFHQNEILMIPVGIFHGICFSYYLIFTVRVRKTYNWDDEDFVFALMAAFLPFATLWVEKKLARLDRQ